ncbi:hypothetical protein LR48_Vigan09g093100 [Vigna angularis]|uniref:Uncharacterized protein n=1 Tax=Phaseolus angularis TaxID=3914 RepID=A0A0L9VBG7_PHAAN|nr:hypothetical protein LR48_Vigan09g093100 [Vigna angularis]
MMLGIILSARTLFPQNSVRPINSTILGIFELNCKLCRSSFDSNERLLVSLTAFVLGFLGLERSEVLVLVVIWTDRTNLGWQLMRVPVTSSPGCTNTEATQIPYSPDKEDEGLEEALNEENLIEVEVKTEQ